MHFFQISEKEQSEIIWIKPPPPPPLSNLHNSTKKEGVWKERLNNNIWEKIGRKVWNKLHLNIGLDTKYFIIMQLCRNQKFPVKDCWFKSWTLLPASMKQSLDFCCHKDHPSKTDSYYNHVKLRSSYNWHLYRTVTFIESELSTAGERLGNRQKWSSDRFEEISNPEKNQIHGFLQLFLF